jgi:hypothetical protein
MEAKELSKKQKEAIAEMNKAIELLRKSGITIFGMDDDLLYVTNKSIKEEKKKDPKVGTNYNPAADTFRILAYDNKDERCGSFDTGSTYMDSGGW